MSQVKILGGVSDEDRALFLASYGCKPIRVKDIEATYEAFAAGRAAEQNTYHLFRFKLVEFLNSKIKDFNPNNEYNTRAHAAYNGMLSFIEHYNPHIKTEDNDT